MTKKFRQRLLDYIEWAKCTTPASDTFQARSVGSHLVFAEDGVTAEEGQFAYETHGRILAVAESNKALAAIYSRGKANRDWWTKEIGWFNKNACFIPEEFIGHLHPLCFIELFGHGPVTHLVRYFFDNHYSDEQMKDDADFFLRGFERVPDGVILRRNAAA